MPRGRRFFRHRTAHVAGLLALFFPGFIASPAVAQPARPILIENIELHPMDGTPVRTGSILIRGSRIVAVGENIEQPRFARRFDGSGLVATPGLVDVQSVLGLADINSSGGDATAIAADGFDRYDTALLEEALRQGVTMIHLAPVGRPGIAGRSSLIHLTRESSAAIGEVHRDEAALCIDLNSAGSAIERLQLFDRIRRQFRTAQDYQDAIEIYEEELEEYEKKLSESAKDGKVEEKKNDGSGEEPDKGENGEGRPSDGRVRSAAAEMQVPPRRRPQRRPPPGNRDGSPGGGKGEDSKDDGPKKPQKPAPNRSLDVLIRVMDQELPVRIRAERSEDLLNALELAEEFSLRVILEGAAEAHLIASAIAAHHAPLIIEPAAPGQADLPETIRRRTPEQAATLSEHGIHWHVGSGTNNPAAGRFTLLRAQLVTQQAGTDDDSLEVVTARAARLLGIDDELGQLAPDRLADLVLWSGDPLDPASQVVRVYVNGTVVFEAPSGEGVDD